MPAKPKKDKLAEDKERCAIEAKKAEESEVRKKEKEERAQSVVDAVKAERVSKAESFEVVRLAAQADEDTRFLELRQGFIENLQKEVKAKEDWLKYLGCNPLPDVEKENQLNTYLSMYKEYEDIEDLLQKPHKYIDGIVKCCCESEQVVSLMESVEGKAKEEGNNMTLDWCKDYYTALRDITNEKLDKLTIGFLHVADEYEDESQVVNQCYGTPDVKYGCWIHTSAKSRVKSIHFEDINIEIDLPVALQKSRTCIRAVQCSYDHFSAQMFREAQKNALKKEDDGADDKDEEAEGEGKKKKKKKGKKKKKAVAGGAFNVSVGGVVNIQQCGLPPPPKHLKRWTMREITSLAATIITYPYPAKVDGQQTNTQAPAYIRYRIPDDLYVHREKPLFGWWDEKKEVWETEGISGIKYDPENRFANFGISTLKPFAVIQPRALDFPYLSWSVCPNGYNKCLINVQGSRFDVQLEVVGGKIQLLQPSDRVLAPLNNVLLDPGVLLTRMAKSGINLMPTDHDAKFCRKPLKVDLEQYLHKQVSMICAMFDVKGSRWNGSRGVDKCMFRVQLVGPSKMAVDQLPPPGPTAPAAEAPKPMEAVSEEASPAAEGEIVDTDTGIVPNDITEQRAHSPLFVLAHKDKAVLTQTIEEKCDETVLEDAFPHVSLRRCLSAYYDRKHVQSGVNGEPGTGIQMSDSLAICDEQVLAMQETVRRTLTLLRVFTFY